ncbi:hypothetical protein ACFLWX_01050 [Chloroflexota bacterium]
MNLRSKPRISRGSLSLIRVRGMAGPILIILGALLISGVIEI